MILMDCYQASDVTDRARACLLPPSLLPPPPPPAGDGHIPSSNPSSSSGSSPSSGSLPSSSSGTSPCLGADAGLKLSHFEVILRSPQGRGVEVASLAVPAPTEGEGHSKVG